VSINLNFSPSECSQIIESFKFKTYSTYFGDKNCNPSDTFNKKIETIRNAAMNVSKSIGMPKKFLKTVPK